MWKIVIYRGREIENKFQAADKDRLKIKIKSCLCVEIRSFEDLILLKEDGAFGSNCLIQEINNEESIGYNKLEGIHPSP